MATKKASEKTSAASKGSKTTTTTTKKVAVFHNPYKPGSVIANAFEACRKGTTVEAIEKMCAKAKVDTSRVLRQMKWGAFRDAKWAVAHDAKKGTIKIAAPKAA